MQKATAKPSCLSDHLNWMLYEEQSARCVLTLSLLLPCPLPSLLTVLSGSKESVSQGTQGLTLTCTSELARRQVADAVYFEGKKYILYVCLCTFFFYAEERNYLHFFQKVDFKSTNEM